MSEQRGVKVVITEPLACGHFCSVVYPMDDCTLTVKTGPILSINPTNVFPDFSTLFPSPDRTLELSGKRGDTQFIGIIAKDGCFACAQCGALLFAIGPSEKEQPS